MFYIYADGELLYNPASENRLLLKPALTLEMGKAGSLSFDVPPSNYLYDRLRKMKTIITVEQDGEELFRGRILSENRNFQNLKTVYCEGDLSFLVDSVQQSRAYRGTAHGLFRQAVENHNAMVEEYKQFRVGRITVEDRDVVISGQSEEIQDAETRAFDYRQIALNATVSEWSTTYDYLQENLISYCGGYLRTRREADGVYLDYLESYEGTAAQEIEFGVNLLDLTEEISAEDLFTVLIPLGDDNLTIASVNGGSNELVDEAAAAEFGRIVRTHIFDSVTDPKTLLENGQRYMATNVNVPVTITATAVDLHLVDSGTRQILLGDSVPIRSAPHSIIDTLVCTRIEFDLENAANNQYTFGNPRQTLTERYRKDIQKTAKDAEANAARGGGGAGAAAEETTEDETQKKLDEWYKAYINVFPEQGNVSLGALFKRMEDNEEVLKRECGIDLSAPEGNINITTLRADVDKNTQAVLTNFTRIEAVSNDTKNQIALYAEYTKKVEQDATRHYAELSIIADETQSAINLKADKTTVEGLEANLETETTNINSRITNINSDIINIKADLVNVKKLVADQIEAMKADVTWLHSKKVKADTVSAANGMYCKNITITNGGSVGGSAIASQDWVLKQLKNYTLMNHTHKYSFTKSIANGHTHTVTVNGTRYTTAGVSVNGTHKIEVSGTTGQAQ